MADGSRASRLPFPSVHQILGDNAPSPDPAPAPPPLPHQKKNSSDTAHARRPSKDASAKKPPPAPRKASAVDTASNTTSIVDSHASSNGPAAKPKQTKSRNGCTTCKLKRLKCGEEKPHCQNCIKRKVACGGYKKTFQWREFDKSGVKNNLEQQRQSTVITSSARNASGPSSKSTTPSNEVPPNIFKPLPPPKSDVRPAKAKRMSAPKLDFDAHDENEADSLQESRKTPKRNSTSPKVPLKRDSAFTLPVDEQPDPAPPPEDDVITPTQEFANVSFEPQVTFAYRPRSQSPAYFAGPAPTLTELLMMESQDAADFSQDFIPFSMPDDVHLPLSFAHAGDPALADDGLIDEELGFIEPMQAMAGPSSHWSPFIQRLSSSTSVIPPGSPLMPWNTSMPYLYMQPGFPLDSPESLMAHFDRTTCGVLSIMDGPTENPWRSLVLPMAHHSAALNHAVLAMTAYHHAADVPPLKVVGHEHKSLSIQNIQEGITHSSMSVHAAIATALALGFCDSWDQHTVSGNAHIKGAQALVRQALEEHRMNPLEGDELRRLKFLCNAWVYMDVIVRLTAVDSDDSNDFDNTFVFAPGAPDVYTGNKGHRKDGFGINFGMPIDHRLDPLMGCAGTLFPLIGRVANLIRRVCRTLNNSPGIVSKARDLKLLLDDWDPPEEIDQPEDSTVKVQHAVQTAEAYRLATLLHLHSAVPELPSAPSADLARRVLAALATVPLESRTVIVQIYPLMVAGCEAHDEEDREWVRERWQGMADRMRIGVIDKCKLVTEEVWRRKDLYEKKPMTQRKLVKTTDLEAARRRGATNKRKPDTALAGDPGQIGIVFSYFETDGEPIGAPLKDINGPEAARFKKHVADRVMVDPAYSVRGHLHWVGVMWDWSWEILLG